MGGPPSTYTFCTFWQLIVLTELEWQVSPWQFRQCILKPGNDPTFTKGSPVFVFGYHQYHLTQNALLNLLPQSWVPSSFHYSKKRRRWEGVLRLHLKCLRVFFRSIGGQASLAGGHLDCKQNNGLREIWSFEVRMNNTALKGVAKQPITRTLS